MNILGGNGRERRQAGEKEGGNSVVCLCLGGVGKEKQAGRRKQWHLCEGKTGCGQACPVLLWGRKAPLLTIHLLTERKGGVSALTEKQKSKLEGRLGRRRKGTVVLCVHSYTYKLFREGRREEGREPSATCL